MKERKRYYSNLGDLSKAPMKRLKALEEANTAEYCQVQANSHHIDDELRKRKTRNLVGTGWKVGSAKAGYTLAIVVGVDKYGNTTVIEAKCPRFHADTQVSVRTRTFHGVPHGKRIAIGDARREIQDAIACTQRQFEALSAEAKAALR
jgi:hypothetical protein